MITRIEVDNHFGGLLRIVGISAILASVAVAYAELIYRFTSYLYRRGTIKRYGPMPRDRNVISNWCNAFGFLIPSIAYGYCLSPAPWHWRLPRPLTLYGYTLCYMVMHDLLFYTMHRTFHASRTLYRALHAKHHEYTKSMNVFVVGFAEVSENLLQVGVPWLLWTAFVSLGGSVFLAAIPMSVTIFTTLVGHSGAKMHPLLLLFHPWAALVVLPISSYVLTPGDHQMHHVYRRCNMGLFFRYCDKIGGTYRQCSLPSHDFVWWSRELSKGRAPSGDRIKTSYEEVEVSFGF